MILFRSKRSDLPSFFFTINSTVSTYSYDVKRFPQPSHSLRLLTVLSGESLVSRVLRFSDPQYGHFIMVTVMHFTASSVYTTEVNPRRRVSLFKPFPQEHRNRQSSIQGKHAWVTHNQRKITITKQVTLDEKPSILGDSIWLYDFRTKTSKTRDGIQSFWALLSKMQVPLLSSFRGRQIFHNNSRPDGSSQKPNSCEAPPIEHHFNRNKNSPSKNRVKSLCEKICLQVQREEKNDHRTRVFNEKHWKRQIMLENIAPSTIQPSPLQASTTRVNSCHHRCSQSPTEHRHH